MILSLGMLNMPPDNVIDCLPSSRIDTHSISHLTVDQQTEFLELIDKYPQCFTDRLEIL